MRGSSAIHGCVLWLGMHGRWSRGGGGWRGERGFTLTELVITLVLLGILIAIAVMILLGILEQRRVDAATRQLVADMRLAHTSATNQLTDWRVVLAFDRSGEIEGPDYYMLKLSGPSATGYPKPTVVGRYPHFFPGNVKAANVKTPSGFVLDNRVAGWWLDPWDAADPAAVAAPSTRTLEFNADGTMRFPRGPNGSTCVTVDSDPQNRVISRSTTSQVKVEPDSDCDTSN